MSVFDVDAAARRSPDSIRGKEFAQVKRGYDPDQVHAFLNQVASSIEQLDGELRQARTELSTMSKRGPQSDEDPYERLAARVAEVIRTADRIAEQTRKEAQEEAARLLSEIKDKSERQLAEARDKAERQLAEAREKAEKQLTEAKSESEKVRRDAKAEAQRLRVAADAAIVRARTEAEALLANLMQRRDSLLSELHSYRERLIGLVGQLEPVVKSAPSMSETALPQIQTSTGSVPPPPRSLTEPFDRQRFEQLVSGAGESGDDQGEG
jgi:DivIVA domain-containing protein